MQKPDFDLENLPRVSVLVAARNEQANIEPCLEALLGQQYPQQLLEIWVGNDQSTDQTAQLVETYSQRHSQIHLLNIDENIGLARGKANVLAQLACKATGEYLFIADADVRPNPHWIMNMLKGFHSSTIGIVNGTTLPVGRSLLHKLQAMDWVLAQGIIRFLHRLGIDYTAVGNNMVISRKAYEATGGYEQIPFSITEDLALFQAAHAKGYKLNHLFGRDVLATTVPQHSWASLLSQRVRWMHGAGTLPLWQQMPLFLQMLFLPLLLLLLATGNSDVALLLLGVRWLLFSISWGLLRQWQFFLYLPVFEFYAFMLYWQTVLQFYTGRKVVWKDRTFSGQ